MLSAILYFMTNYRKGHLNLNLKIQRTNVLGSAYKKIPRLPFGIAKTKTKYLFHPTCASIL